MQGVHSMTGSRRCQQFALYASVCGCLMLSLPGMAAAEASVKRAAGAFYNVYMRLHIAGVPSLAQQAKLAPVVAASLAGLLRSAGRAEAAHRQRTKNQEPPLVEGDLFTSLFEGANAYTITSCTQAGETAQCLVTLTATDPRDRSKHSWTDQVLLTRQKGRWVVADVVFGGGWDFARKGRLTDTLRAVVTYRSTP